LEGAARRAPGRLLPELTLKEKKMMFSTNDGAVVSRRLYGRVVAALAITLLLACAAPSTRAQNALNIFSSGSTGADGAFAPTSSVAVVVPDSGVFNYTTINIPGNVTVTYLRNSKNRPVTLLASGDVTIAGTIIVDAKAGNGNGGGGAGGPGGYDGGSGGYPFDTSFVGITGDGPGGGGGGNGNPTNTCPTGGAGGGYASNGNNGGGPFGGTVAGGPHYGASTVTPLIGGSGGGGGAAWTGRSGGAGGGGGGAILIASSGTFSFTGTIAARGGAGGVGGAGGGGGSGGAIRLVANTITGGGSLLAHGGGGGGTSQCYGGGTGGSGFIRVEAYDYSTFNPSTNPGFVSFSLPHPAAPAGAPALRIASVAGVAAPTSPLGSLHGVPDIVVPTTQANPVAVALEATNVPVGTVITVTLTPAQGTRTTAQSAPLAGTEAASTASANVSLPAGMSVVSATAVIDLTQTASTRAPVIIDGERVDRIEVAATFGGASEVTYVTHSGRRIKRMSE
jgi:hypothetical protein